MALPFSWSMGKLEDTSGGIVHVGSHQPASSLARLGARARLSLPQAGTTTHRGEPHATELSVCNLILHCTYTGTD
jgi:hypothetical protein